MRIILTLFTGILLFATTVHAGGFQLNEHNARAMAMGGAFTAIANDASALYFNTAGITQQTGLRLMLGTALIRPQVTFRGPSPSINENKPKDAISFPSHLHATLQLSDHFWVGLSVNNPFGSGTEWDKNWVGRFVNTETKLRTYSFNPSIAYKFDDELSIGFGFYYNLATVVIEKARNLAPFNAEALIRLEGDETSAFGWNIGVLGQPLKDFTVGIVYKSKINYEFSGTAKSTAPAAFSALLPNGNVKAKLTTPDQLIFGLGYKITPDWIVAGDAQFVFWKTYDKLAADFEDPKIPDLNTPRMYEDTYILRLGTEYQFSKALRVGIGFMYDNSPIPDEHLDTSIPDSDRFGYSVGAGLTFFKGVELYVSYRYLTFRERTVTTSEIDYSGIGFAPYNGTYNTNADLLSASLSFSF